MKIAIIGGGTAGFIAAAHLTKYFPAFELYHIFDPNIPTIGVGEGTTPFFRYWLQDITNLKDAELAQRCFITRKFGIKFENWGTQYQQFFHHFYPIRSDYAYHISADQLVELLADYVSAIHIQKRVVEIESDGVVANINFADDTNLEVDFAIDARGLPKSLGPEHMELNLIPTNAALIRRGPAIEDGKIDLTIDQCSFQYQSATRAIARPHGWIFTIPLTTRTSYGYIYNHNISSISEVRADFDQFLNAEGVHCTASERQLTFPNFACRTFFDGAVFRIGNAALFLEPLEATAIVWILSYMKSLSRWPLRKLLVSYVLQGRKKSRLNENNLRRFNASLLNGVLKTAIFVGWHYGMGSAFDSEFWRFAKGNFQTELQKLENSALVAEFDQYCQAALALPHPFKNHDQFSIVSENDDNIDDRKGFASFPAPSFAEVGCGIGCLSKKF